MARRKPGQITRVVISGAVASGFTEIFVPDPGEIINGTNLNDTLFGSPQDDQISGDDGDDQLLGDDGQDTLEGGLGNDTLWGESGSDTLIGGDDDDQLIGGSEEDTLEGGLGNDTLWGESGSDTLIGGDGDDQLIGGSDEDLLEGGAGNDTLWGESDNDTLIGGDGDDELIGGDSFLRKSGSGFLGEVLEGGAGNDYLNGFGGGAEEVDSLTGGAGFDTFVIGDATGVYYQSGGSNDTEDLSFAIISDFLRGEDFIQASGSSSNYELDSSADLLGSGSQDTGIYLGDDLIAVVQDTTDVDFDRDFIFV